MGVTGGDMGGDCRASMIGVERGFWAVDVAENKDDWSRSELVERATSSKDDRLSGDVDLSCFFVHYLFIELDQ